MLISIINVKYSHIFSSALIDFLTLLIPSKAAYILIVYVNIFQYKTYT